jgi:tetratricopeptide (TPR) repeat protein
MDLAKKALTSALTLRPDVEHFYTNLGAAYYFRGDFDSNINLLLIAKRLRPDHARIYYNLGHAYRYKGDKARAIEAYKRYVAMGEKGEEARVQRAKQFIAELNK